MSEYKTNGCGNKAKKSMYAFAFKRIKQAIEAGFYLEAITIEESIICDRLYSALLVGNDSKRQKELEQATVGSALGFFYKAEKSGVESASWLSQELGGITEKYESFYKKRGSIVGFTIYDGTSIRERVAIWWRYRCSLLHGIVTSTRAKSPAYSPEDFIKIAKDTAELGLKCARAIDTANKKVIHRYLKEGTKQ